MPISSEGFSTSRMATVEALSQVYKCLLQVTARTCMCLLLVTNRRTFYSRRDRDHDFDVSERCHQLEIINEAPLATSTRRLMDVRLTGGLKSPSWTSCLQVLPRPILSISARCDSRGEGPSSACRSSMSQTRTSHDCCQHEQQQNAAYICHRGHMRSSATVCSRTYRDALRLPAPSCTNLVFQPPLRTLKDEL
jgi:hypothetical protein